MENLLLWLVVLPILGALACIPLAQHLSRVIALTTSLIGVILSVVLYCEFDSSFASSQQMAFSLPWLPTYGIRFGLGIDGLSFPLVMLTKWMMPIAILASWSEERKPRFFMLCLLLLDSAMTGTFLATDIFLFYVFWEVMLIPMLLLIGIWGSTNRIFASLKFFLFTFAGSIFMLAALFWIFVAHSEQFGVYSSTISDFYRLSFAPHARLFGLSAQEWVFLGFTIAFAIKIPLFPLHTWLPDAHVQAPTGGSILLAAVLLKMGTYGLLRFSIPICPDAFVRFAPYLAALSLVGIVYGAWVAFQQTDMKKLVAYSSVSHLGFVVLGICSLNTQGLSGAVLQSVNHGISTGALFLMVGMLYERRHSRNFADYGGIAPTVPWLAFFLVFVACSSMAVPGLNGFLGEFLILLGTFETNKTWALIAVTGVVFGALYMLSMIRQVLFGPCTSSENKMLKDLNLREWFAIIPLCIFMILLGVAPKFFVDKFSSQLETYWAQSFKKTSFDAGLRPPGRRS